MNRPATGAPAPEFALRDQHGATVRLDELRGRLVLLVFYPFAFSRVCTGELGDLRDAEDLAGDDVAVLAISCDPMFALRAFADAERLTLPLLSDFWPHGEVAAAYGVLDADRGAALRSTYLVDREGNVAWQVHHESSRPRSVEAYRDELRRLGAGK